MFSQLLEELLQTLPHTPAQIARVERAIRDGGRYTFTDRSETYEEAAVRVQTPSGGDYLCFPNQCTCMDWSQHGPVIGDGSIEQCKHQIAAFINAEFVEPATPGQVAPAFADGQPLALTVAELEALQFSR